MPAAATRPCSIQFLAQLRPFCSALAWARPTEYRIPGIGEDSLSDTYHSILPCQDPKSRSTPAKGMTMLS